MTSFGRPRCYSLQPPTLFFFCSGTILPEECAAFFSSSVRIFLSKDKKDHTCWQAAYTQRKGWLDIHDNLSTAGGGAILKLRK